MDLITQAVLGATTAQAAAKPEQTRMAVLTGALAGLLPDADALIRSSEDPLLVLEYHRHFSHSLLFIPVGAAIIATLVWWATRKRLPLRQLYLYALLGILLSGLLDACTSYGTHLFWPFSDDRISWNLIAIVEPVFTLLLLIPLVIAYRRKQTQLARLGLALAAGYLMFAVVQQHRATNLAEELIADRGHTPERHLVKPTLGNLLLWRSIYIHEGMIYADAVRASLFRGNKIYTGESTWRLVPEQLSSIPPDSRAGQDLQRFAIFSDGWLTASPSQPDLIGDARYSMLPTGIEPLWGVKINRDNPEQPLEFVTRRATDQETREIFLSMLSGRQDSGSGRKTQ